MAFIFFLSFQSVLVAVYARVTYTTVNRILRTQGRLPVWRQESPHGPNRPPKEWSCFDLDDVKIVWYSDWTRGYQNRLVTCAWWRHQMEAFSAILAICAGNSPVPGEFPTQRPVTRSFDVFFDLRLNKRLSKQWWGWWFETLSRPLWDHRNVAAVNVGLWGKPYWLQITTVPWVGTAEVAESDSAPLATCHLCGWIHILQPQPPSGHTTQ